MVSKELRFSDYQKCVFDSINPPITKEQVIFRNIKHVIYTITNNKIALHTFDDKGIIDKDEITTYPLGSNIPLVKYFDDKDIPTLVYQIINFDNITGENINEFNANWL